MFQLCQALPGCSGGDFEVKVKLKRALQSAKGLCRTGKALAVAVQEKINAKICIYGFISTL